MSEPDVRLAWNDKRTVAEAYLNGRIIDLIFHRDGVYTVNSHADRPFATAREAASFAAELKARRDRGEYNLPTMARHETAAPSQRKGRSK